MYGAVKHPATWWAVSIDGRAMFVFELGRIEPVQSLLSTSIRI